MTPLVALVALGAWLLVALLVGVLFGAVVRVGAGARERHGGRG